MTRPLLERLRDPQYTHGGTAGPSLENFSTRRDMFEAAKLIEQYKRAMGYAIDALQNYADPESYHAIMIIPDRPAGGFADDFGEHDHPHYDRPMPGKLARRVLNILSKRYGDLEYTTYEDAQ